MATVTIFVFVDRDGDNGSGADEESARQNYIDTITDEIPSGCRTIEITLTLPDPQPIKLTAIIPADALPNVPVTMIVQG